MKKKSNFVKKNLFFILLVFLSILSIVLYYIDKQKVAVLPQVEVTKKQVTEEKYLPLTIFIYNPGTKSLEEKVVQIEEKADVSESDYLEHIFKNSPFVSENMKFQSIYELNDANGIKYVIKLNSEIKKLQKDQETYNGFLLSIQETLKKKYGNVVVEIHIDGDAIK